MEIVFVELCVNVFFQFIDEILTAYVCRSQSIRYVIVFYSFSKLIMHKTENRIDANATISRSSLACYFNLIFFFFFHIILSRRTNFGPESTGDILFFRVLKIISNINYYVYCAYIIILISKS
jgi:hypothetical protein